MTQQNTAAGPRNQRSDEQIAADQLARRFETVAARLRTVAESLDRAAARARKLPGTAAHPLPYSMLASDAHKDLLTQLANSPLAELLMDAAEAESARARKA